MEATADVSGLGPPAGFCVVEVGGERGQWAAKLLAAMIVNDDRLPARGPWSVRFGSGRVGYSPDCTNRLGYVTVAHPGERDGMAWHGDVVLGLYSALVLSQGG